MVKDLDAQIDVFRNRPLDAGPYTFVAAEALVPKVRDNGRVVNVHTQVAVGVNAEGYGDPGHWSTIGADYAAPTHADTSRPRVPLQS